MSDANASNAASATQLSVRRAHSHGFTLVEMLVVLSVVSILSILATAGLRGVLGTAYDGEVSDISNTLMRARAYAMANNTYVFVGIEEVDASKSSSGVQTAGNGRLGITTVASIDGTRIYSTSSPGALTAASLAVISPLRHFENVHLLSAPTIANLPNASASSGTTYDIASSSASSATTFSWPLTGTTQYNFGANPGTVIQFNPQGEAQIVHAANTDAILQWIEIDLVPSHGNNISGTANPATILIDGASGSVSIYRS